MFLDTEKTYPGKEEGSISLAGIKVACVALKASGGVAGGRARNESSIRRAAPFVRSLAASRAAVPPFAESALGSFLPPCGGILPRRLPPNPAPLPSRCAPAAPRF